MATTLGVDFDPAEFTQGIHTAMSIGIPEDAEYKPTFYFRDVIANTAPADEEGVPFAVNAAPIVTQEKPPVQVLCALEYSDGRGRLENIGEVVPSTVVLSFLEEDYLKVEGFAYVMLGGIKYLYSHVEPPLAMVTVGVWMVHVQAEDQT